MQIGKWVLLAVCVLWVLWPLLARKSESPDSEGDESHDAS